VTVLDGHSGSGRIKMVSSGQQLGLRLGLRGTEELGNGYKAMFTIEQIRSVGIFRSAHESVLREGPGEDSVLRRQIVSKIIDRCMNDLVMTTLHRIQASRVRSVEDVRHVGGRLVSYSDEMAPQVHELKAFLFTNMYRNWRVMRMADKAGRILRDLFGSYIAEPLQLPPQYQARFDADGVHRVICDYIAGMTDRFAVDEHRRLFIGHCVHRAVCEYLGRAPWEIASGRFDHF
jgi:dGTPase